MYKHLFIVRHGSSPLSNNSISDFDRTLDKQGINDSLVISERFSGNENLPNKILTSPAIRALHSATIYARTLKYPINNISIQDEMYLADKNIMLDIIKQTDNKVQSLIIFGHNPTFTDLANHFLNIKIGTIPSSGIVGLKFELELWSNINRVKTISSFFDHP